MRFGFAALKLSPQSLQVLVTTRSMGQADIIVIAPV
jgi:hypothetical protein